MSNGKLYQNNIKSFLVIYILDVRTFGGYKYGPGLGNIYFVDMTCTGAETCLVTCPSSTDTSVCTHDNDAGVRCEGVFSKLIHMHENSL